MVDATGQEERTRMRKRSTLRVGLVLGALLTALCAWTGAAQAHEGINSFQMIPSTSQAGGHPDVFIEANWDTSSSTNGQATPPSALCGCDDARVLTQHFPTGFIGNPTASPPCEIVEFSFGRCPASTQVGTFGFLGENFGPIYNISPHPDEPSLVGFWVPLISAPQFISLAGRTESDYGLDAQTVPIYHPLAFSETPIVLWGVPADPIHDSRRFAPPLVGFGVCNPGFPETCGNVGVPANVPPIPYLENPTECNVPLTATLEIEYYTHGFVHADAPWPSTTGCEQLTFNPSLTASPTTHDADSPSGVDIVLSVPQEQSPSTPAPSEIRSVKTTLPVGFSLNPNAADGKESCSDPETAVGTRHGATCPDFAKVGTLTLESAALPEPIPGAIYIGEPKPNDTYRLLLAADGYGTHVKLLGSVQPDPVTGQIVVRFDELPQSPLTRFDMHFFGSERGILATPTHCGSYPVESEFVPWDNVLPPQRSQSSFTVDAGPSGGPCPTEPRPFSPSLRGGSVNPSAGKSTPISAEIERKDGEQFLSGIQVTPPPGALPSLRGVEYCPESALQRLSSGYGGRQEMAAPLCPASSQIGTSTAGAGSGSRPIYLGGKVYLAGPYKGRPLSLAVVTPAVSGPYDLGNVVVRAAIAVDPVTTQASVVSDPLPRLIKGIPLRLREVKVALDRQNFTRNPTNCRPFAMQSVILGEEGGTAGPGTPFQVTNCASLPYEPKLSLTLTGGLNRRGHPAIHGVFVAKPGEANSKDVSVTVPKGEQLDNGHIGTVCTRVAFLARACPAGSIVGAAKVTSPLLDNPLSGAIYLRSSDHKLPDLVMDLHGQVDVQVSGRLDSVKGRLRASFESLPDVPISRLEADFLGGAKGLLINSKGLCDGTKRANEEMIGQNNAQVMLTPKVKANCGSGRKKRSHGRRAGR